MTSEKDRIDLAEILFMFVTYAHIAAQRHAFDNIVYMN